MLGIGKRILLMFMFSFDYELSSQIVLIWNYHIFNVLKKQYFLSEDLITIFRSPRRFHVGLWWTNFTICHENRIFPFIQKHNLMNELRINQDLSTKFLQWFLSECKKSASKPSTKKWALYNERLAMKCLLQLLTIHSSSWNYENSS